MIFGTILAVFGWEHGVTVMRGLSSTEDWFYPSWRMWVGLSLILLAVLLLAIRAFTGLCFGT